MAASRNNTGESHSNPIADDQAQVARNVAKMMTSLGDEGVPTEDTVVTIARALGVAERQREYAESQAKHESECINQTYEKDQEHASDLTYALRNMLSHHKASSLDGAAVQTAELISLVDMLWDQIPEEVIGYRLNEMHRSIERLLHSVLDCLNGRLTLPVEEFVYPHFTNRHINPWTPINERFAMRGLSEEVLS